VLPKLKSNDALESSSQKTFKTKIEFTVSLFKKSIKKVKFEFCGINYNGKITNTTNNKKLAGYFKITIKILKFESDLAVRELEGGFKVGVVDFQLQVGSDEAELVHELICVFGAHSFFLQEPLHERGQVVTSEVDLVDAIPQQIPWTKTFFIF